MATAEFSKFARILSAALSQHHLSGFEIAQLEFHSFSMTQQMLAIYLWFLCLFEIQLELLEVLGSCTVEDFLGEF